MAPFGLKLWESAFQMVPDISFVDTEKALAKLLDQNVCQHKNRLKIDKLPVLEELWIFEPNGQMGLGKRPPKF